MVKIPDNIYIGIVLGGVLLIAGYYFFLYVNHLLVQYNVLYALPPKPKIHLMSLFVTVIIFRMLMIKWQKTEAGRGVLFAMFVALLLYYFFEFRS